MHSINRRSFLRKTSMSVGAALALSQLPKELFAAAAKNDMPIGFQSWSVKEMMGKDFTGTLKTMADMGYKLIELCSPKGYEKIGFGFLANMSTADIKKTINDAGLECPSCHFGFAEVTDKVDESIAFAKDMGLTQMICSTFWLPKTATLNDYIAAAEKLNKGAEKIKAAGMQAGFHNHEFEFAKLDGQLIYDALMKAFDANLVKMQFQTEVINLGYKAVDYFKKYPGRFISAHLSDWTADKQEVPVGQGIIAWNAFFKEAKKAGVQNYFVEMGFDKFNESAAYIHSL